LLSAAKTYVSPSITTIANAASAAKSVSATNFNLILGPGKSTYPLANFSWAIFYQKQAVTNTAIVLGKLFQWISTTGQTYSASLGYAPLPAAIVTLVHKTLLTIETASGQPVFKG